MLRVLDLTGGTEVDRRVQAGRSPAEVLIEHLGVTQADVAALVDAARAAYDPQNTLAGEARRAARRASREGPVFDGDDGSPGDDGGFEEAIELTEEQAACIDEALGESEDGPEQDIPAEVWEKCVGA